LRGRRRPRGNGEGEVADPGPVLLDPAPLPLRGDARRPEQRNDGTDGDQESEDAADAGDEPFAGAHGTGGRGALYRARRTMQRTAPCPRGRPPLLSCRLRVPPPPCAARSPSFSRRSFSPGAAARRRTARASRSSRASTTSERWRRVTSAATRFA